MKRYACHHLYATADGCYSRYVVELDELCRVKAYFPLKEEIPATQWIGGVIVLSPSKRLSLGTGECFADFLQRAVGEPGLEVPVYAWHIACFDFQKEGLLPESSLVCLE